MRQVSSVRERNPSCARTPLGHVTRCDGGKGEFLEKTERAWRGCTYLRASAKFGAWLLGLRAEDGGLSPTLTRCAAYRARARSGTHDRRTCARPCTPCLYPWHTFLTWCQQESGIESRSRSSHTQRSGSECPSPPICALQDRETDKLAYRRLYTPHDYIRWSMVIPTVKHRQC